MHNLKNLINNIGWLYIGTIISNIISVFVTIFLIRKLPVEEFGIYSLFLSSMAMFGIFSINGVIVALRRYIPELIQKKYFSYLRTFVKELYFFSFSLAALIIIVVFIFKNDVGSLLQIKKFDVYFSIFIINIVLFLEKTFNNTVLTTLYKQKFLAILGVVAVIIRGVLYAVFLPVITIELIFIIEAIALGVNAIGGFIYQVIKLKEIGRDEGKEITPEEKKVNGKRVRKYIALSTADEMGESAFSQVSDYYFVSAFLGPTAVGIYAFPYKVISSLLNWISLANIYRILKPYYISQYYNNGQNINYLNFVYNFLTKIFFLFLGFILIMIVAYQNLINVYLFSSKYIGTETLLVIIVPYYLGSGFMVPNQFMLEIKEKIQYTLYAKMFAVFNILAVVAVLKFTTWGLLGVGAATALSAWLRTYYVYYYMKKSTSISINVPELFKAILLLSSLAFIVISSSFVQPLLGKIFLPAVLGVLSLIILIKVFNPFNLDEKQQLNKLFDMIPMKVNFLRRILAFSIN